MQKKNNIDDIYTAFTKFENEKHLNTNKEFSFIWSKIRFEVFENILNELCSVRASHDVIILDSLIKKIINRLEVIYLYFISKSKLVLIKEKDKDYLFWGHPRRKLEDDNLYWDIYTDPIIQLQFLGRKYLVCENQYQGIHLKPTKTNQIFYPDYMLFELALQKLFLRKKQYSVEVQKYFKEIEEGLNNIFNLRINIVQIAQNYAASYKLRCKQYSKFLQKVNPKVLFIIVGYNKEPLIRAAKYLHIPVIELQHGVLSKYHLGYDVSSGKKDDFADYFFSFGPAWGKMAHFPIPQERIIPIGYQYLNTAVSKLKGVMKKDQILFLSQGTIGDRLSDFAVNLLGYIPNQVKIIFKLHPGEYLRWKTEYKSLYDASEKGLITVIAGDKPSLYELMAESKWQIGVNSTALFEGMAFKCKTYIVDLPGIEYVETLIDNNEFILVQKPEQIEFTYDRDELNYRTEEYFSQDTETKFKAAVDFVMKDYYA